MIVDGMGLGMAHRSGGFKIKTLNPQPSRRSMAVSLLYMMDVTYVRLSKPSPSHHVRPAMSTFHSTLEGFYVLPISFGVY